MMFISCPQDKEPLKPESETIFMIERVDMYQEEEERRFIFQVQHSSSSPISQVNHRQKREKLVTGNYGTHFNGKKQI